MGRERWCERKCEISEGRGERENVGERDLER